MSKKAHKPSKHTPASRNRRTNKQRQHDRERVEVRGGIRIFLDDGTRGVLRFSGKTVRARRVGGGRAERFALTRDVLKCTLRTLRHVDRVDILHERNNVDPDAYDYPKIKIGRRTITFNSLRMFRRALRKEVMPLL